MKRSILYLQYTNPANYPPLEHSGLVLINAGWVVRYFGIQSEGESNKLSFPEPLAERVCLWKFQFPGTKQKLHYIAFTLSAWAQALWEGPSWVYCSDLMSCPAAWLIGRFSPCKVLYHEHDSPISDFRFPISDFQKLLLWFRKCVGREADLVIFPNEKRLEIFTQTTRRQKKSLCAYNCPRREEVLKAKAETLPGEVESQTLHGPRKTEVLKAGLEVRTAESGGQRSSGILRLAFHGSINRERLPLAVLEAMSQLPGRVHLSVVGYETVGAKNYMAEFQQMAKRLGLGQAVEFLGALPTRADLLKSASRCDVGLAFMPLQGGDVNMAHMTGASNKPFDYLACGLALLVSDLPDWRKMFVEPGYGLACDPADADSIAVQLRWFLEHPLETRAIGERGRQRIMEAWNYERQFESVLNYIS